MLGKESEDKIVDVISKNMSAFAWSSSDMTRIYATVLPWMKRLNMWFRDEENSMKKNGSPSEKKLRNF